MGSLMGVANRELIGECRPFMVIENVIVSNKHRRMGIGKMLTINAMQHLLLVICLQCDNVKV